MGEKRIIINFRAEDAFTGCNPKVEEWGNVDGKEAAIVFVKPGISCLVCDACHRCKNNYIIVDNTLPSEISTFSNS